MKPLLLGLQDNAQEKTLFLLAQTLKCIKDAVTIADQDDRILYVNPAFTQIYGYTPEEVLGKDTAMLRSPLTDPDVAASILPATLERDGWEGELFNRRKDGSDFPIFLSTSVVRDDTGTQIALVGIVRDITEQKQAQKAIIEKSEEIRAQGELLEQKNKSLTENLNFGKKIQESILPAQDSISRFIHQIGIHHRAKDIISGDFYWYSHQFDRVFLSLVDGGFSGVPGAFLSVLIQSLLNQIVNDAMTTDPHIVLSHLQDKLVHLFEQEESAIVRSQAGMGVAFLSLTKNFRSLRFSGANISLFKLKFDKLQEIPGDELPLGLENHDFSPKQFTQHTIQVGVGDTFYLFTSGITQQKNPAGEILGKDRLLDFFIRHSQATIAEQIRLIRQFLDKWRGNTSLSEDELLICFRI